MLSQDVESEGNECREEGQQAGAMGIKGYDFQKPHMLRRGEAEGTSSGGRGEELGSGTHLACTPHQVITSTAGTMNI